VYVRPAKLGVGLLAAGVFFLAISGGPGSQSSGNLLVGIAAIAVGISLLAPLCLVLLTGLAGPRAPVAIRIALRDLVRYRARSGAALAATCFAVFLAMLICMVASIRFSDILDWTGPNLTTSQLIVTPPTTRQAPARALPPLRPSSRCCTRKWTASPDR
jgi:putative ABC transport system permease protein